MNAAFMQRAHARKSRNHCQLLCGRPAVVVICGIRVCAVQVDLARAIAADAGVAIDEEMLAGKTRIPEKRKLRNLEQLQKERAAVRRRA